MYDKICKDAEELKYTLSSYRRDFHKYAERGWLEMRTSSLIARRLKELGYEVLTGKDVCEDKARMGLPSKVELENHYEWTVHNGADNEFIKDIKEGFTGVIGILDCSEGPVVVMRFDIDALGVYEDRSESHRPKKECFISENNGVMHACGHDGHTSIGLGVAEIIMNLREHISGKVK